VDRTEERVTGPYAPVEDPVSDACEALGRGVAPEHFVERLLPTAIRHGRLAALRAVLDEAGAADALDAALVAYLDGLARTVAAA
jgi:hypothetical protein